MKTVKFMPELVSLVLSGEKTTTWRLFDDKDLQIGDDLILVNKKTLQEFARATIVSVTETELGKASLKDLDGHEKFKNREEMIETYKGYYGPKVTPESILKVIRFRLK